MLKTLCSHMPQTAQSGFTLVELMTVIAVVAILLTAGIPAYQSFLQNVRAATASSNLTSALAYARSEAVRRSIDVELCGGAPPTCSADWAQGWFVRPADAPQEAGNVLREWPELGTAALIAAAPLTSDRVRYSPTGQRVGGNVTFSIQPVTCSGEAVRVIAVGITGRALNSRVACP